MFTMSRPLSTLLLLLTLLCMVSWSSPAAAQQTDTPKMYAVLEDNGTTLRFKYDTNMPETGGYPLDAYKSRPSWNTNENIKNVTIVIFDKSCQFARPERCDLWFWGFEKLERVDGLNYLNTEEVKSMSNMFWGCKSLLTLDLSTFNTQNVTNMYAMFYDCQRLKRLDVSSFNTQNVTDMSHVFEGCYALTSLDLSSFKTQNVITMADMFSGCSALTKLDVSGFDTQNVTNMSHMFGGCSALTSLNLSNFKTQKVTNMAVMFSSCSVLTSLDLTSFDTQNVTQMDNMFSGCKALTSLDLTRFDTQNVTRMNSMFSGCKALTSLDLSSFKTQKVTNMEQMFSNCSALTSLDLSSFTTQKFSNMKQMFSNCSALTSLDLSNFSVNEVTATQMFQGCTNLATIYVSESKFGTPNDGTDMFKGCDNLKADVAYKTNADNNVTGYADQTFAKVVGGYLYDRKYLRPWVKYDGDTETLTFQYSYKVKPVNANGEYSLDDTHDDVVHTPAWNKRPDVKHVVFDESFAKARPTTCAYWFYELKNLEDVKGIENLNTEEVTNMSAMFAYCSSVTTLDLRKFNTKKVTDMSHMFNGCYKLESMNFSSFNTQNVTTMEAMFVNCRALGSLDLSSFDTQKVTNMKDMFAGCSKLTSFALPSFDTRNVTDMSNMFSYCTALTTLDLSKFDTRNVTDMADMFYKCQALTTLDLSNFDTRNVMDMSGMFSTCSALTTLDLSSFNTQKVTTMEAMFGNCPALITLDLSSFDTQKVRFMTKMFTDCSKLSTIYVDDSKFVAPSDDGTDMFKGCDSLKADAAYKTNEDNNVDGYANQTFAKVDGGYFLDKKYIQPWVRYDAYTGQLTFLYGSKIHFYYDEYKLNGDDETPGWVTDHQSNIKHVTFDSSFAQARPTTCSEWFSGLKSLEDITGLEFLNTEKVTDMSYMFENCRSLASLDLRNFDTGNVWNMYSMFAECCGLKSLDLSHFDTRNVINMQNMFSATYSYDQPCLTTLDLSNFNTEKVVETEKMFAGNNKLQTIYVGDKFVLSAITEDLKGQDYRMFDGCTALKGAVAYNAAKTDMEMANYTTGYLTKLVAKVGDEKIGAVGETLKADCTMNLSDDKDLTLYGVEGFKVSAANYTRDKVTGGQWASLCLPFKISMNEAQPFHAYTLLSATNDVITLKEEMADIEAGTPLLIHMNEGATELSFNGKDVDIKAVKEGSTTENAAYQLVGLYATKMFDKGTDNNCYIVKGDKLMNPAKMLEASEAVQKVGSRPYRAYVQAKIQPTAQANMLSIAISDEATGIKAIDALNGDAPAEYYDMQGRRINGLQKGINIVKRGNKTTKVIVR